MTLDTATVIALIGFGGAVIGSLGAVAAKYYLDNRRERQREKQRVFNLRKYGYPDEESRIRNALEREVGQQQRKVGEMELRGEISVTQLLSEIRELKIALERKERELALENTVSELRLLGQIRELQLESEISELRKDGEIRELQIGLGIEPGQEETPLQLAAPLEEDE